MSSRTIAVLLSLAAAAPAAFADEGEADHEVLAEVRRIQGEVTEMRGLEFRVPVRVGTKTPDEIREMVIGEFDAEEPAAEIAEEELVYKALGFLPDDYDLRARMIDVLSDGIAGYYDPEAKELFVVDMSSKSEMQAMPGMQGVMEEMALAHELHHALQDQHFGINDWFEVLGEVDDDRLKGYQSLVEGEAQLVGMTYMFEKMGQPNVDLKRINRMQEMAMQSSPEGAKLREIPPFVLENLMFPYTQGAEFVQHVQRTKGWDFLGRAFGDPPTSTEQILHPEKYLAAERDEPVELLVSGLPALLGEGAEELYANTFGEFNVSVLLRALGVSKGEAAQAAAGWDGDSFYGYQTADGRVVVVWLTTWDSEAEAEEFERTYRPVLEQMRPDDHLERRGTEVLLVHGSAGEELDALVRRGFSAVKVALDFEPLPLFHDQPPLADFTEADEAPVDAVPSDAAAEADPSAAAATPSLYRHDGFGVSFVVPEGFALADEPLDALRDYSGEYFAGPDGAGLRLMVMPISIDAAREQLEGFIEQGIEGLDDLDVRDRQVLGREAFALDFAGKLPGEAEPTRHAIVAVAGGHSTVIVSLGGAEGWDASATAGVLEQAVETLWVDAGPPASEVVHQVGPARFEVPDGFRETSGRSGPLLTTIEDGEGAKIQLVRTVAKADLEAAAAALEAQLPLVLDDYRQLAGGVVDRGGRPAHVLDFTAKGRRTRQVTYVAAGFRWTLACSAPADGFAANQPAFGRALATFRLERESAGEEEAPADAPSSDEGDEDGPKKKLYSR